MLGPYGVFCSTCFSYVGPSPVSVGQNPVVHTAMFILVGICTGKELCLDTFTCSPQVYILLPTGKVDLKLILLKTQWHPESTVIDVVQVPD